MEFLVTGFLVILGGTILVSGVITGTYCAFQKIYGISYPALFGDTEKILHEGILPELILKTGVFSILGIWTSQIFLSSRSTETVMVISGGREMVMIISGIGTGLIFALGYILLAKTTGRSSRLFDRLIGIASVPMFIPHRIVFFVVSRLLSFLRFNTIICNHCLRLTKPLYAKYSHGRRYCEHCQQEVEHTTDPGKVILTFGTLPLKSEGRVFILSNLDFEQKIRPIELSEVYIDIATTDRRLFERFITYLLHYPPLRGVRSVQIFYRGELDDLGENLKNTVKNTFEHVEVLPPGMLSLQKPARAKQIAYPLWKPLITVVIIGVILAPIIGFVVGVHAGIHLLLIDPQMQWEFVLSGNNDDVAYTIQLTPDGGYVVAGRTWSRSGMNTWVIKLDTQGQLWEHTFSSSNYYEVNAIQPTLDGGCVVTGRNSPWSSNISNDNAWVIKLDTQGQQMWEYTFGGNDYDKVYTNSIQSTPDEGYVVVGHTWSVDSGNRDIWISKLNAQGQQVWERAFGGKIASTVQPTLDGGYVVAGTTEKKYPYGSSNMLLLKLDAQGRQVWKRTVGGQIASTIQPTLDGGYIVAGEMPRNTVWVSKIDAQGRKVWKRTFTTSNCNYGDEVNAIQPTLDGGYIVAGNSVTFEGSDKAIKYFDAWVFKLDAQGRQRWVRNFRGSNDDRVHTIQATPDGGYIIAGSTRLKDADVWDVWIFKFKPDTISSIKIWAYSRFGFHSKKRYTKFPPWLNNHK